MYIEKIITLIGFYILKYNKQFLIFLDPKSKNIIKKQEKPSKWSDVLFWV